ncbi:PAAR domain-containing protein [Pseudomonas sp. F1_0610]|uniref:PAAR domain-containing protein n=1 Tax=Pseudomonas sp. F1_0610 TaxID=3114284 RepID=UPI0039C259C7
MKNLIRVDDQLTPHGGKVLTGKGNAFGKPIARVNDTAVCNKHGQTTIIEGCSRFMIEGQAVALDGHSCACGCRLVSSLSSMQIAP